MNVGNQLQEKNIICPYCGAEDGDSWEHREEYADIKCWECDKWFNWSRDCRVTYDTKQLCSRNNIEHQWIYFDHTETNGKQCKGRRCDNCDEYEFDKEDKHGN